MLTFEEITCHMCNRDLLRMRVVINPRARLANDDEGADVLAFGRSGGGSARAGVAEVPENLNFHQDALSTRRRL